MRIEGAVRAGKGKARERLRRLPAEVIRQFGFEPYPGTLNVACSNVPGFDASNAEVTAELPMRRHMQFYFFKARLQDVPVWVARSLSQFEEADPVLEIIADRNLREQLGLADGDVVELILD